MLTEVIDLIVKFSGHITVLLGGILSLYHFSRKVTQKLKPYADVINDLSELNKKVDAISAQFQKNGGSSMRDSINKIILEVNENTNLTKSIRSRQMWLLDTKSEPLFEADKFGGITWANASLCNLTGRPISDLLGARWRNSISEDKREQTINLWEKSVNEKRNFEHSIEITNKSGEKISSLCIATISEDGSYIGCLYNISVAKVSFGT